MENIENRLSRLTTLRMRIGRRGAGAAEAEFGTETEPPRPGLRAFTDARAAEIADACALAAAAALDGGDPDAVLRAALQEIAAGRFHVSGKEER